MTKAKVVKKMAKKAGFKVKTMKMPKVDPEDAVGWITPPSFYEAVKCLDGLPKAKTGIRFSDEPLALDTTETLVATNAKRQAVVDLLYCLNPSWDREYTMFVVRGIWRLLRE